MSQDLRSKNVDKKDDLTATYKNIDRISKTERRHSVSVFDEVAQ